MRKRHPNVITLRRSGKRFIAEQQEQQYGTPVAAGVKQMASPWPLPKLSFHQCLLPGAAARGLTPRACPPQLTTHRC